ncbi:c-type cytochrome [Mucilaginibacter robiniae]|uniref:Photosynthetic reaction center cytochrome c subunit n=1 Tax=Mucilaginibacter robiniae TaxID=2728022 RepID=A0A7L5E5R7_9SPHI|nr:c-type cytochrome [Mucilaginibacter robiniae]QJD97968.1 c-type cytochrome [Mucilaginibacter robiniae]
MLPGKKFFITIGLLGTIVFVSTTAMQQQQQKEEHKYKNLKVLPKNITEHQMHEVMEEWEHSLGVRCNFCHVRNEESHQMDWASDTKPEKEMAREMYRMTANLNKKHFKAGKDSIGMIMETGVNCNMCHHGQAHPEVKMPERPMRPQGQPGQQPGGGQPQPPAGDKQP